MATLTTTSPGGAVQTLMIDRRLTLIGSADECHLQLELDGVGSSHATITRDLGVFRLESSSRSTPFFVGGKKMRAYDLRHGDVFVVGGAEILFSTIDASATATDSSEGSTLKLEALRHLQKFSQTLQTQEELSSLLDTLIDQVVELTRAKKGFLVLANALGHYEVKVARNLERQPVDDPEELFSDEIIRETITSRSAQIISDACNDTRYQNSLSVINLKLSSVMCVPLLYRSELLGLIYVGNDDVVDLFVEEQLEVLKIFASQAALFVKTAISMNELKLEAKGLEQRLERFRFGSIVGSCAPMLEIYSKVERIAKTDVTVLISGETGTGKELIAHEIHRRSSRESGPFITVNCGAIPETLIESELFGHVKGAFTGAVAAAVGKFQAAHKGTLFLDEIGELPIHMQVKILRILQEREVQRIGESKTTPVDIRIVTATNRKLQEEVDANRFREDLFFRLNVINIELPPLRERGDDVLLLARYFIKLYAAEFNRDVDEATILDSFAEHALSSFSWPGNIRQLDNHIKKAMVLFDGPKITAKDLDLETAVDSTDPEAVLPLSDARDLWQRKYINSILSRYDGNRTRTARALGVDPRTIFRHLEKEKEREQDGQGDA